MKYQTLAQWARESDNIGLVNQGLQECRRQTCANCLRVAKMVDASANKSAVDLLETGE